MRESRSSWPAVRTVGDLHEDAGDDSAAGTGRGHASTDSATTKITYTQKRMGGVLDIARVQGSFPGQADRRAWTVRFGDADRPQSVTVDGRALPKRAWSYDATSRTVTVGLSARSVDHTTTVRYTVKPAHGRG